MAAVISVASDEEIRDGRRDLTEFRERVYACLSVRRDALFDVLDAVCCWQWPPHPPRVFSSLQESCGGHQHVR